MKIIKIKDITDCEVQEEIFNYSRYKIITIKLKNSSLKITLKKGLLDPEFKQIKIDNWFIEKP